jgi:FMN reductase (NADPH)
VRNNLSRLRDLIESPEGVYPLFGLCVGVPAESPGPRPRLAPEAVLFDDAYPEDAALLAGVEAYDAVYRAYLAERGARPQGWSDAMVAKHNAPTRADAGAFYASRGARLG